MAEEKPYTKEIILPASEKSNLTVCEMATGKTLFSKKCRYGSNGVAFHPIDDNYIISYTSALGDPHNINLLQIHPLNDTQSEYTIELDSIVKPLSHLVYFTINTLFCYPDKNELLVMINDVWHALPNYFISREKMFLIKTTLETILPVKDVSNTILMLIRNSGCIHEETENLPFFHIQGGSLEHFALEDYKIFRNEWKTRNSRYCDFKVAGYSCNGKYIALVLDKTNTLVLRNTLSGFCKKFSPREREILAVGFHPNNNVVAVIDDRYKKNNITYFDIITGEILPISSYLKMNIRNDHFPNHTCPDSGFLVRQLVFSEDGLKAYVIDDNQLMCFDVPREIIDFKQNKPKKVHLTVPDEIVECTKPSPIEESTIKILSKINEQTTTESEEKNSIASSISLQDIPNNNSPNNNRSQQVIVFFKNNRLFFTLSALGIGSFCIGWLLFKTLYA